MPLPGVGSLQASSLLSPLIAPAAPAPLPAFLSPQRRHMAPQLTAKRQSPRSSGSPAAAARGQSRALPVCAPQTLAARRAGRQEAAPGPAPPARPRSLRRGHLCLQTARTWGESRGAAASSGQRGAAPLPALTSRLSTPLSML